MNRVKTLNEQPENLIYLKETPAEKAVFGVLTILIGLGIFGSVVITLIGIQKSGDMNFFDRMQNTVKSWSSDYYDIRTDITENDTIIIGTPLSKTNPDIRKITANLHEDSSCGRLMPGSYGTAKVYIIPHDADADLTVELSFNVYGFVQSDNGEYLRIDELENDYSDLEKLRKADSLLDGHFLFFTENDNGYCGLLKDGIMTYNMAEHQDDLNNNGEYEVTIYWIRPEYYVQLTSINAKGAVIKDAAESKEMKEYINEHQDCFFYNKENENDDLTQQYDNADLFLHQNVEYYGFEIIALN